MTVSSFFSRESNSIFVPEQRKKYGAEANPPPAKWTPFERTVHNLFHTIDMVDENSQTELHRCAQSDKDVQPLLNAGANIELKDDHGRTPLFYAVQCSNYVNVERLMHAGANIHGTDLDGQTLLHVALEKGDPDIIEALLTAGINKNITENGKGPLHIFYDYYTSKIVDLYHNLNKAFLLCKFRQQRIEPWASSSKKVNPIELRDSTHKEIESLNRQAFSVIWILLKAGISIDEPNEYGETILMHAARFNYADSKFIQFLIKKGAKVNATDNFSKIPLLHALGNRSTEAARILLKAKADVNTLSERDGTPLHLAASYWQPEIIPALLDAGADTEALDLKGKSVLDVVYEKENKNVLKNMILTHEFKTYEEILMSYLSLEEK